MKLRLIESPRENKSTVWMIQTEEANGTKEYLYFFMGHIAHAREDDELAKSHAEFYDYIRAVGAFHAIKDMLTRARHKGGPRVVLEEDI